MLPHHCLRSRRRLLPGRPGRICRALLILLLAVFLLNMVEVGPDAGAAAPPEGSTYQDPPGPPFTPDFTNLPTAPTHQKFGIAAHPWWLEMFLEQFIAYYKDLKVSTVRLPFNWKDLEPEQGKYKWDLTDRLLNRLNDEGFEVVAEFVTVPVWASANPTLCAQSDYLCSPDPAYKDKITTAAFAVAKHYPFIRYWEFWNEPDQWPNFGQGNIENYGTWLKAFYEGIKQADPTMLVAATSLSGPAYTTWLYNYFDPASRPWDAVAYHPYLGTVPDPTKGPVLSIRKDQVDQLRQIMVEAGDAKKPIWLTEIGWTDEQGNQSLLMRDAFDFVASRPFITLAHVHMLHDWDGERYGLMRVKEDIFWKRPLNRNDQFEPKQPYYDAYKSYNKRQLPSQPKESAEILVFPDTFHTVRDAFKKAYEQGDINFFGLPQTGQFYERSPTDGKYYLVQYFERARMEYHPENRNTPYEVLYSLLGTQLLSGRGWFNKQGQPIAVQVLPEEKPALETLDQVWFSETGHTLSGLFLQQWQKQGGIQLIGLPISGVFNEQNPDDGNIYQVQYFERARAELHPAQAEQPAYIAFGLLGRELLRSQGRITAANRVDFNNYYNPALPEFN